MAIAATSSSTTTASNNMSQENESSNNVVNKANDDDDDHEHDVVMPGFRFHPTEEELVEFYLRRKVEGKRFNVELITFLDLYRYDPWELPALAAIGEKEWFFYVPRDRKYRNGDRPNRVTTSGYWKATGADRMIRTESSRSIGLKKTLVFYSGKAPKGIRTSWIMNEYRLPQHETERYQKAEISLCRVYKRPGVEDHPSLPRSLPSRASPSTRAAHLVDRKQQPPNAMEKIQAFMGQPLSTPALPQQFEQENMNETDGSSSSDVAGGNVLGVSKRKANYRSLMTPLMSATLEQTAAAASSMDEAQAMLSSHLLQPKQISTCPVVPITCATLFPGSSSSAVAANSIDDLHRLVNYQQQQLQQQQYYHQQEQNPHQQPATNQFGHPLQLPPQAAQAQLLPSAALNALPNFLPAAFSDRLWEWNPFPETNRDYSNNPFK
ncbi:NAC domain-containing protein 35 [Humulus lupulus]|uniref:NAC domain-containing protein 35 n=1 Tax=Humulus lupulus TaxID=3486 RepID=UPI002B4084D8|nr:NAC domain-containing protein 35 [Humulus lupulus]